MSSKKRHSIVFIIMTTALASCISMIGGIGIELTEQNLLPIIPLVIALPALNTMVGDYATIIAAHAGSPGERAETRKRLIRSIAKSTLVNITGVFILSLLLAHTRQYDLQSSFIIRFGIFIAFSVSSIVTVMFGITYTLDKILEQHKLNPDDVLIPIVTTVTDVFMLGLIALSTQILF
ncbi:MAG TPA: magnesium transporter [Candidatus Saccharibacteria bacterium]|jgi:cation transporter-like permease|nr:magnesium transporter [Candidatus Saccharibacteria bacterium]